MKKFIFTIILGVSLNAGVYTNQLIKCMVKNTTPQNITTLKKWMFFAFAQDSDLKKYAKISLKDKKEVNKEMGKYVTKLLTDKCAAELKNAVKYEGAKSISIAFEYLGRIAGSAITSSPDVKLFFSDLTKYVDMKKLDKILK
ncbi:hypothetical protein C3L23_07595 [Nautilia sp. PV-1]|uniref:hypothetical protein n=1 Tax=Nautilia sp. PV-1 TaxID=2579250 RepID=UPI000FD85B40|nr:hypothetical protein [Nautilia sp. PV-1]AZV47141.1 hypothetical protein C3L23_07595 [Nautilia sp. PV-1]